MTVDATLNQRQGTHGDFKVNAELSQELKQILREHACCALTRVQQEALDNICQKISRIIVGNPNHADNWHDIAGYATLAERECNNGGN